MAELTKEQFRIAKDILKIGILHRHEQWQRELSVLLIRPFDDEIGNAYDRSMAITKISHEWFKETNRMEYWYNKHEIIEAIRWLVKENFISQQELEPLLHSVDSNLQKYLLCKRI